MPKLIVVDEASMVDETIYQHLQSLGTKVLYVGDHGQLPPVKSRFNLMAEPGLHIKLENIHRQAEQSPILLLANEARRNHRITEGRYGEDVLVVSKGDLALPGEVYPEGDEPDHELVLDEDLDTLMICATNKIRVRMNRLVREALGFPADRPVVGDRVICLRNNWEAGIVNGTTGIIRVLKRETPALHYAEIEVLGEDRLYKGRISASQFDTVETELGKARDVDLWTYGYCLTCHKSQGSEADKVIVIEEYLGWMKGQQNRWRYTAYTRAKQELTVIRYGRSESVDRIGVATYNPFPDA